MILACETCGSSSFQESVLMEFQDARGRLLICSHCLAEKAFPPSPAGVPTSGSIPPAGGTSFSASGREGPDPTKTYFGCPGIGDVGDAFYVASHSAVWKLVERGPWPGALCSTCYDVVLQLKKAVGGR